MDDDDDDFVFDELDYDFFDTVEYQAELFNGLPGAKTVSDILYERRAWVEIVHLRSGEVPNFFGFRGIRGVVDGPYV